MPSAATRDVVGATTGPATMATGGDGGTTSTADRGSSSCSSSGGRRRRLCRRRRGAGTTASSATTTAGGRRRARGGRRIADVGTPRTAGTGAGRAQPSSSPTSTIPADFTTRKTIATTKEMIAVSFATAWAMMVVASRRWMTSVIAKWERKRTDVRAARASLVVAICRLLLESNVATIVIVECIRQADWRIIDPTEQNDR